MGLAIRTRGIERSMRSGLLRHFGADSPTRPCSIHALLNHRISDGLIYNASEYKLVELRSSFWKIAFPVDTQHRFSES